MGKLVFPALNTVGNENNVACGLIDPNYQLKFTAGRKSSESRLLVSMGVFLQSLCTLQLLLVKNSSLKQK